MIGQKWNVLVTGGAGYVGSVLVPKLLAAGHKVTVLDLYMYGEDVFDAVRNNPNLRQIKGDIRDRSVVNAGAARLRRRHPSRLHLQRPVVRARSGPRQVDQSTIASVPLVRAAKKAGVKRFIYASSSSVYGIKDEAEVTEDLSSSR